MALTCSSNKDYKMSLRDREYKYLIKSFVGTNWDLAGGYTRPWNVVSGHMKDSTFTGMMTVLERKGCKCAMTTANSSIKYGVENKIFKTGNDLPKVQR
jgi:hypothetical protein